MIIVFFFFYNKTTNTIQFTEILCKLICISFEPKVENTDILLYIYFANLYTYLLTFLTYF